MNKNFDFGKFLDFVLSCDIIYFIMGTVTFILKGNHSYYEELEL